MLALHRGCGVSISAAGEVMSACAWRGLSGPTVTFWASTWTRSSLISRAARQRSRTSRTSSYRTGNVTEWYAECAYDLVYGRYLLQHLRRPVDLLGRMWEAVAPGGTIAVEDADFEGMFSEPANEGFEFLKRMYPQVLARYGGDSTAGRKLHGYFLTVGIPEPELRLLQRVDTSSGEAKTLCLLTLEATADAIVSEQLATRSEVDMALESLAAFTDDPQR
jgi:hypothetical protein